MATTSGKQSPRYAVAPRSAYTDGPACGKLAGAYGLKPDPWQQTVLDGWLACRKDGSYVAGTAGLAVPRQNGKNGVLEMVELFKLSIQGRKVLHTAHEVKTCRKAFIRLRGFFESDDYPELKDLVKSVRQTNGQEGIFLANGGSVEFIARSKSSGRGFTVDDVVLDEAQELTDEQLEVLRPTMSASPTGNPQMMLTGTPTPPASPGTVFERVRKEALTGTGRRLAWFEWSVEHIGDVRDKGRWAEANPALGYRVQESVIEDELASMSDDGFARERLGWWSATGYARVIDEGRWASCETDDPPQDGKMAFGVKFSPDGRRMALCASIKQPGSKAYVELLDERDPSDGVTWLAGWLDERRGETACVVIDGKGYSDTLASELKALKYPAKALVVARSTDVIAANTMFLNSVNEKTVTHYGQRPLTESATLSERRDIGTSGGWGFGGDQSSPVEAAALAYWGVMTTKRNPGRRARIL